MFPRTQYGQPVADPARAVARGPLQISGFEPRRRPRRLSLGAALAIYFLGVASAALILARLP